MWPTDPGQTRTVPSLWLYVEVGSLNKDNGPVYWIPEGNRIKLYLLIILSILMLILWIISFIIAVYPGLDIASKIISGIIFIFLTWILQGHAKEVKTMEINLNKGIHVEQKEEKQKNEGRT
jgi:hypothetical protein